MKKYVIVRLISLAVLWVIALVFVKENISIPRLEFVLGAVISLSSTLTGFLFTGVTLLVGLKSDLIREISRSNDASLELKLRCIEAIFFGLAISVLSIACGICADESEAVPIWCIRSFLVVGVWFLISFIQLSYYLIRILLCASNQFPAHVSNKKDVPR